MSALDASEAREKFADTINRAAYGKERVIVKRRGKPIAAVVPIQDLELLERLDPKIAELTTAVEDKTGRWPEELRLM